MKPRRVKFFLIASGATAALACSLWFPRVGASFASSNSAGSAVASGSERIDGPYFSDQDRIADHIVAAMRATRNSMDIAVYSLTERDIGSAIVAANRRGVRVRLVADEQQALDSPSEINYLQSHGVPVRVSGGFNGERSLMHDKFAIFDGKLVETGSFNWTVSGEFYNFENAIFILSPAVAARYESEFQRLWKQAQARAQTSQPMQERRNRSLF